MDEFSMIAMRTTSPIRKVMSTKYLPVRRSTIGPITAATPAASAVPAKRPTGQGMPNCMTTITEP